jgi:hypothetical protein
VVLLQHYFGNLQERILITDNFFCLIFSAAFKAALFLSCYTIIRSVKWYPSNGHQVFINKIREDKQGIYKEGSKHFLSTIKH